MAEKTGKNDNTASEDVNKSDIFTSNFTDNPSAEEVFCGAEGLDFLENGGKSAKKQKAGKPILTATMVIVLLLNITFFAGAGVWVYYNLPDILAKIGAAGASQVQVVVEQQQEQQQEEVVEVAKVDITEQIYEGAVSFEMGEKLFDSRDYPNAYLVFKKLNQNLTTNIPSDKYLSDYLHLKMALSLNRYNPDADTSKHFEIASQSISPFVRAFTNYHLAFIQIRSGKYLLARQSIYKTLSLLRCFDKFIDENFEPDCYFIACEALTRQVLALNNRPTELPANGWTNDLGFHRILPTNQDELIMILEAGIDKISKGALMPKVTSKDHEHIGVRFSSIAVNAPLDEVFEKMASIADKNILWRQIEESDAKRAITINFDNTLPEHIAEIAAGSTGLIARFDDRDIMMFNPQSYDSLENQKELLTQESIALWRRFLMRYRGDHRSANASFARALMLDCAGHKDSAINHYTRTANRFTHHQLAPYSLLNSSGLRTDLRDYAGAQQDLTQIIMQYRDSKITNQAYLDLARAAMNSKLYREAIKSFKRLYNTDMSDKLRAEAAYGAGMCFYNLEDYKSSDEWLMKCINFEELVGLDYTPIYFTLGKAKIEIGQYDEAAIALKNSLKGNLPTEEVVNILIQLAIAQTKQGNFVDAMDTIENITTDHLSQELIVEALLTKSYILRSSELPENAVSILRHRLAYLSNANLRGRLSLELSKCYSQSGDYQGSRDELIDSLKDLKPGKIADDINLELAGIYLKLSDFERAVELCNQLLASSSDESIRVKLCKMLGEAYTGLENYDMAAFAYAGKIDGNGGPAL